MGEELNIVLACEQVERLFLKGNKACGVIGKDSTAKWKLILTETKGIILAGGNKVQLV